MSDPAEMRMFDLGMNKGMEIERERIINWIEENRSKIELEAGIFVYRDHFDSESLLNFINENK